jgi:O-succinylbenzoate synthase
VHVYSAALKLRFRGLTVRQGVLFEGPAGWAEFAPFVEYGDDEAANWLRAAHEAAFLGFPQPVRTHVPVNVTVPATYAERAFDLVRASNGCTTAKVKVAEKGQTLSDEVARLEAVRAALGPSGKIRVDANGGWDVETARARLAVLDRAAGGLEYAEQPCAQVEELAQLRRTVNVLIAADESIRRAEDPLRVAELEAADVMVVKVAPLGGVRRCLELVEQIGLPVVVSSALDSSVGLSAGLALAAALPELPFACGLATSQLFVSDVTPEPLLPVDGQIAVRPVVPEPGRLAALAAPEADAQWWRERTRRVAARAGIELPVV